MEDAMPIPNDLSEGMGRRQLFGAMAIGVAIMAGPGANAAAPTRLVKVMTLVRRKAGVDRAAFLHAWTVTHADMARSVPGVVRFVVNPVTDEPGRSDVPELMPSDQVDGVAETWFDAAAMVHVGDTPQAQAWYRHGAEIFGFAHNFKVEEIVVVGAPV